MVYRDDHSDRTILDQTSQPFGLYATTGLYHSHNHVPIVESGADSSADDRSLESVVQSQFNVNERI